MKKKAIISLSIIIAIIALAFIGIKMIETVGIEKIILAASKYTVFDEPDDAKKFLVGFFGSGGGSGGSSGGGGSMALSGEDVQNHKNNVFCIERDGNVPYRDYENDSFKNSSGEEKDGTLVGDGGKETTLPFDGAAVRVLDVTYEAEKYEARLKAQTLKTITAYQGSTRDMTLVEQYLFANMGFMSADRMQELVWQLYEDGGTVLPSGGTASSALDEAKTYDAVIGTIIDPSLNADNPTVSYSYTNEEFLIGPFSVDYTRYYVFSSGENGVTKNGKVNFSGIVGAKMVLDDKDVELSEANFVYPNARVAGVAQDTGYEYPYPGETFYVRLPMSVVGDSKIVETMLFKFSNFVEGEGTIADLSGKYVYEEWVPDYEEIWCEPPKTFYICFGGWVSHGKLIKCDHGKSGWCGKKVEQYDYCEHGKNYPHIKEITEWLELSSGTVMTDPQDLVMALRAALYEIYRSRSVELGLSLRMDYGGIVWEDEHTGKMQDQDGLLGAKEKGIEGVKVTITGKHYGNTHTVYTDENGKYFFSQMKMDQYVATFEYDGQVWEPTTYFAGGEDEFAVNSKAQENAEERIAFNNKFKEIIEQGGVSSDGQTITSIEYDTNTLGKSFAITNNSFKKLSDEGNFFGSDGLYYGGPVEGDYEKYKMTATTMDENYNKIHYPRENEVHIEDYDKVICGTNYVALYPKITQINLGLVRRTAADFEVRKDVYKAIVQINGKTEEYTYSSRDNITESFDVEVKNGPDYGDVEYNRAIYRSDYNYRIEDYNDSLNPSSVAEAIAGAKGENSELKIYIVYKITIANRSSLYSGTVNELVDYYDEEYTYINSWYGTPTSTENTVVWQEAPKYNVAKEFEGYDTLYTQTTAGLMLDSGKMLDIYMKFEVDKHEDETGKEESIFLDEHAVTGEYLGGKNNVVEINNYSTFKPGTTIEQKNNAELVEGKIDRDSHAGNTVATDKNTFEDDTDGAPRMNIILHKSEERSIYGYVWDDDREEKGITLDNGQIVGNGIREDGETPVNGVVVQLIEKVEIDGTTYEYIWREMESGESNMKYLDYEGNIKNGTIYKAEDGSNHVWDSEDTDVYYSEYEGNPKAGSPTREDGYYFFDKYVPGNYIVRFIYGDNSSTIQTDANGGKNAISYNGQDYKSTMYRANEYEVNSIRYYDLASNEANASKARDNAIRRLNVNNYSKTMYNHIGNVLAAPYATPNNSALIQELRDNTWMYADTAYIKAEVAYNTTGTELGESQNTKPVYKVENIGFGLEERPRTNIVLTKQIENVTVTLVNGTVLVNTAEGIRNGIKVVPNKYDHSEQGKNNYLGFWSFEIDDELIQGAELKIYYRLTVENNGQVDSVGSSYNLNEIPSNLRQAEAMLGNAYYYGNTTGTVLVTTAIDKILDYIDRSIVFNSQKESNNGVWYDVESLDELKSDGLIDKNINIYPKTADDMGTSNNTMAMTEILKNTALNPVNNTTTSTLLVLTKRLGGNSTEYNYTHGNIAEIIQLTNTVGRRDPHQIPGNQDPNIINKDEETDNPLWLENDTDVAEPFTITTPTGEDQSMVYYIVAGLATAILAVGIVLIKKFVLSKK